MNNLMGPGFLIFFQQEMSEEIVSGGREAFYEGKDRIKEEDEEILLFVQCAVTYKLI